MRIIGGAWRRRFLSFPEREGLRPTPDRVRETVFNWLGQDLTGKACLDLFAGSGALGFEALSRGALRAVMVESDRGVLRALEENAAMLRVSNVELVSGDGFAFLGRDKGKFDVIFLDPPYRERYLPKLLPLIPSHLAPEGVVYAEGDRPLEIHQDWEIWRHGHAGQVHYYLLKWSGHA